MNPSERIEPLFNTDCPRCGLPADVVIELDAAYCPRCQAGWRIDGAAVAERMNRGA